VSEESNIKHLKRTCEDCDRAVEDARKAFIEAREKFEDARIKAMEASRALVAAYENVQL
jgi:hypothetical protein